MPQKAHKVRPNTLHSICKRISIGTYLKLKTHNDIYFSGTTIKWKLIDYYFHLDGEWSLEREKKDWHEVNLSNHKYKALRWLIRTLAKIGHYPNGEILTIIGELEFAFAQGAYDLVLDLATTATELAKSTEQFEYLRIIIGIENAASIRFLQGEERTIALRRHYEFSAILDRTLEQIADFERQRAFLIEVTSQVDSIDSDPVRERLQVVYDAIVDSKAPKPISIRAELERLYLVTKVAYFLGKSEDVILFGRQAFDFCELHPWLKGRDWSAYFVSCIWLILGEGEDGQFESARSRISKLDSTESDAPDYIRPMLTSKVICALRLGWKFRDKRTLVDGLGYLEASAIDLFATVQGPYLGWLFFLGVRARLFLGNYHEAKLLIERAWVIKPKFEFNHQIHLRLMYVLSLLGLKSDDEFVDPVIGSALQYARNQSGKESYPTLLLKIIESLQLAKSNGKLTTQTLEKISQRVEEFADLNTRIAFEESYPYYDSIISQFRSEIS